MPSKYISHFTVQIDGQNVSEGFYDDIVELTVDTSLHMPSMFSVKLHDNDFKWVDDPALEIGKTVKISVQTVATQGAVTLIQGEITALEPVFNASASTVMCIRGYDKSHRLHLGRKSRTFLKQKDSDFASTIAGECGLTPQVETTTTVHEYVIQYNQTNMEFLLSRADKIGYKVYVEDEKLCFVKNTSLPATSSIALQYAEDLISFEPRWTTSHQANQVTVKGWDVQKKQAIVQTISKNDGMKQGGLTTAPGGIVSAKFHTSNEILVNQVIASADEAKDIAEGRINDFGLQFVQAEGECLGNPAVQAGKKIKIEGVGSRFSGFYLVTSSLHVYNPSGYITHFSISGRYPETLSRLIGADHAPQSSKTEIQGVVTAVVTNLNDPNKLGRVKVKFPWLAEDVESDWARISSPMAGSSRGLMLIPEVNDEVLVAFEHGDVKRPYVVGSLWNGEDKPPFDDPSVFAPNNQVEKRILKTRAGHFIEFYDKQGEESVTIKTKGGHQIVMDDKSGSENVSITDKSGSKLVMNSANKSVSLEVGGDFNVNSKGKINIKSVGNIEISASGGSALVKGTKLSLESMGVSELKGSQVKVNGTGGAELSSSGIVQVQGSLVKIN
jgi:uncharacterized protein involved in type VI secretion and phage assembly